MNRRLRKKLRKGEYDCPLIPIAFRMRPLPVDERNALLDRFITEAIEGNDLQFGGGGVGDIWSGFAEPAGHPLIISEEQRSSVLAWIAEQADIIQHFVGEILRDSEVTKMQNTDPDPEYPKSQLRS